MKQIFIYVILFILAVAGVTVITLNREPIPDTLITIDQYYSIVDEFQKMDIPLYLTNSSHLLTMPDAYQVIYLVNEDHSKKLQVMLEKITIDGEESYLGDDYTRYILQLSLPMLNDDYLIDECYLLVSLKNNIEYEFKIGTFSYNAIQESVDYMFWTALQAQKNNEVLISRIAQILIAFDTLDHDINQISIGQNQNINFDISQGLLTVNIGHQDQLLYGCAIIIYYEDSKVQVIQHVNYLKEHMMLQNSGLLNHVYDVNIPA